MAPILAAAPVLALDAEFFQVRARGPDDPTHRLSLLQIALDQPRVSYVVDALRIADLSPLAAPLADGGILKLFHGIGADARVLASRGLVARDTLDLEAVSRSIFGQRESGLQAMLQRASGVRLDKSLQRADWSRRPLTAAMIAYAARDAEMTLVLYAWLAERYPTAVALHRSPAEEPPRPSPRGFCRIWRARARVRSCWPWRRRAWAPMCRRSSGRWARRWALCATRRSARA